MKLFSFHVFSVLVLLCITADHMHCRRNFHSNSPTPGGKCQNDMQNASNAPGSINDLLTYSKLYYIILYYTNNECL